MRGGHKRTGADGMGWPPLWKIKRELHTARDQALALILRLCDPLRRLFYDRQELLKIQVHLGDGVLQDRLVLYLVYQPQGLPASQFEAIRELAAQGHAVLVMANGGLPERDVQALKSLCWRIIERPNRGYDFGGYRCGLHHLRQQSVLPEVLTLMNDSMCYPLLPGTELLQRSEASIAYFGGAVGLEEHAPWHGQLILSYWLTLKKPLLESDDFWAFWRTYVPASNKTYTVKYGERGLSRRLNADGRPVQSIYNHHFFMQAMRGATWQDLQLSLRYAAFVDPELELECARLLQLAPGTPGWREACLDFVERVAQRRNFLNAFPYSAVAILKVPFIKKSPLRLQVASRQQYLRAVRAGDLPAPSSGVLADIERCTPNP